MKKHIFLLFAALVFSQVAFAQVYADFGANAPSGQILHYGIIDSTAVAVIAPSYGYLEAPWYNCPKPNGALVIPDSVTHSGKTYAVTIIGYGAFYGCNDLTSVTIPNTVISIGCSVSGISYGNNYDYGTFANCTGLTSMTIGNSVTSIGVSAFSGCTGLTSVTIPDSVTTIEYCTFSGCSGLTSVTIPSSVTCINTKAFSGCTGLTSVTIPDSVTTIGDYAFYRCYGLNSVTIPSSVTYIGTKAFSGCSGLTSVVFDADSCTTSIYSDTSAVFSNCTNITSFTIGNNVKVIPHCLCFGLTSLATLALPNSVTYIGYRAFSGCTGLTSVIIPNSVTYIGDGVFHQCTGLTSVVFNADSCTEPKHQHLYPDGGVFSNCTNITSFTIGNNVKVIPEYLCSGLTGLATLTIPDSVTLIGNRAFSGCTGLTSVTIPNSVTYIGDYAFYRCYGLNSVTIPNSVTYIGGYAFYDCSLTSVTIPNSVILIGYRAFMYCVTMSSIKFLGQVPPQLGDEVFFGIPTNIPVYIPCGRLAYYVAQMPQFSNFVEQQVGFSALSDNESMGSVQILTEPTCSNPNAVLYAVPADGYSFGHWSTGSIDNPYTLTVTSDTTVIAYFVANGGTEGIDNIGKNDIRISVFNGRIVIDGVEQKDIQVYDITGRITDNRALPSGVYIVKIGQLPARKVVVLR